MPSRLSLRPTAGDVLISPVPMSAAKQSGAGDAITIAPLPELPEPPAGGGWAAVLPALGAVGMSTYAVLSGRLPVILLGIAGSAATVFVAIATRRSAVRRWRDTCAGRRSRYLAHLADCRERATLAAQRQRALMDRRCPGPRALSRPPSEGSWEVRLGVGRVPLQPPLRPPTPPHPSAVPWPELAEALEEMVAEVSTVDDCPVTLDLAVAGPLALVGPRHEVLGLARALRVQAPGLRVIDAREPGFVSPGPPPADVDIGAAAGAEVPTVVLAESVDLLPASVRTIGIWNADGSLTLQPSARSSAMSRPASCEARQVVARPDILSEADVDRITTARWPTGLNVQASQTRQQRPQLGVVLGETQDGAAVLLDLAESSQGGHGPHGWIVGATGTGKSQLLRRLVVGLATDRSPDDVAFVLVDYKGGAAFDDLATMPHVAGVLTNLDDARHSADVQRLLVALRAEIRRRQQLLRSAAVPDLVSYRSDPGRTAEPHLIVVIDEAAELLGSSPEVLDVLATIGRVGRSLGIHLVLAAQRPDEARLRSLEGALRFRICLRTLTTADSIAVLRDPGAATLPAAPGWALLAVDGAPERFRVTPIDDAPHTHHLARARPVWHPPLPAIAPMPLPEAAAHAARTDLSVLLAVADAPSVQWQGHLSLQLNGVAGHLAVVGAPRTGRSSTLRTAAVNLAATTTPSRLHLYAVGTDQQLQALATLPHTSAVAPHADAGLVLDVVSTVADLVRSRQRSVSDRVLPLHRPSDVVLLIDDWPQLRAALPDLESLIQDIAVAGLAAGVHLMLSAHRWSDLRPGLRDCFGSRVELHLPDPLESLLPRGFPGPPAGRPGRGVLLAGQPCGPVPDTPMPLDLQINQMPPDAETEVVGRWSSHPAPVQRIRPLPPIAVRPAAPAAMPLVLGVGSGGPVTVDLDAADRHLLVVGDVGSGRSTLLAAVGRAFADADCWQVDPRGSLHAAGVRASSAARTPRQIDELLTGLHAELLSVLHGDRRPSRTLLLVDDLDVASALTAPTAWSALATLLPLAADLRLTIAVARRCAGMARTTYEPFLSALRDAGATGVLLDGSPEEGPIVHGVRCRPGPVGRALLVRAGQPPRPLQLYGDPPAVSRTASGF